MVVNQEHKDDFCPKVKLFLFHIFMLVYWAELRDATEHSLRKPRPSWFSDHLPDVMTSSTRSKDPSLRILQFNDPKLWFTNEILNHFFFSFWLVREVFWELRRMLPLRVSDTPLLQKTTQECDSFRSLCHFSLSRQFTALGDQFDWFGRTKIRLGM